MTTEDAATLAIEYDKYDFPQGRKCCDIVLSELFTKNVAVGSSSQRPDNLDVMVDTYVLANEAHLPITKEAGRKYLVDVLADVTGQYGRIMFTESMMTRLAPYIVDDELLPQDSIGWSCFSEIAMNVTYRKLLAKAIPFVTVSGTGITFLRGGAGFDGKYIRKSGSVDTFMKLVYFVFQGVKYNGVAIEKHQSDGWAIRAVQVSFRQHHSTAFTNGVTLWRCPYSSNWDVVPPETGWVKGPPFLDAVSDVKIQYGYKDNDE